MTSQLKKVVALVTAIAVASLLFIQLNGSGHNLVPRLSSSDHITLDTRGLRDDISSPSVQHRSFKPKNEDSVIASVFYGLLRKGKSRPETFQATELKTQMLTSSTTTEGTFEEQSVQTKQSSYEENQGEEMTTIEAPMQSKLVSSNASSFLMDFQDAGEDYLSFVAVRNPWKRLVSLYQQKIEAFLPQLRKNGFTNTKGMPQYNYMLKICQRGAINMQSFRDMLECVLTKNRQRNPNRHWQFAYEACRICEYSYDYIIRTENMMDEGTYVLSQAGVTNSDTLLQTVRDSTIRDVEKHKKRPYLDYWADIPDAMIETLRNSYRWEIGLFQYPDTPFTDV